MPAAPSANFAYLGHHDPKLVVMGTRAEAHFAGDPAACIAALRVFGELLAHRAAAKTKLFVDVRESQHALVDRLFDRGVIGAQQRSLFHDLRRAGNDAAHEWAGSHDEALHQLRMARELGVWFQRAFGNDRKFDPGPFVPPPGPDAPDASLEQELARLRTEREANQAALTKAAHAIAEAEREAERATAGRLSAEEKARRAEADMALLEALVTEQTAAVSRTAAEEKARANALAEQLAALTAELAAVQAQAEAAPPPDLAATIERAREASEAITLDEAATRHLIDAQLRAAGWEADSQHLTYARGARPEKGRALAIAEWPTHHDGQDGRADYALFVGLTVVGIIEAKRNAKNVPGVLPQAKRYSLGFTLHGEAALAPAAPWGKHRVPFLFATNGRPYLRQLETQSGTWFIDVRRPDNTARALDGWYTPDGLTALLAADAGDAHARLHVEPMAYIDRAYQRDAILAVEKAIEAGQRAILLAMATGTGKTRTCIGLCYRLIKSGRFRRILFLVDRTALGEQTTGAFREFRLEQAQAFTDIYDLRPMTDARPEPGTRLQVATVQAMVKRLLGPHDDASEAAIPPIDAYDCVVVDECHRGYVLDKDLSDRDFAFRDEADFISTYRRVLEHFDAVKIGLTATPALHTKEIFGAPVFTYSYREAVIDGFLVDHDPPTRIVTRHSQDGLHYDAGAEVTVLDRTTHLTQTWNLEDAVDIDVDGFHRSAIVEGWNRAVLGYLATQIDPALQEKTLIFCVDDRHADMVVHLFKEALRIQHGSVDDDAVIKVTGQTDRTSEVIRRYRNEQYPSVAVTVDLLTTGIDVPRITNLVFLRRVKSRILYEQMLGRATRLCPDIGKERFRVFDAVDLYAALQDVSDMKPVVVNPATTFAQLATQIARAESDVHRREAVDELVAKLQRKKRALAGPWAEPFETAADMGLSDLLSLLRQSPLDEIARYLDAHPHLAEVLDRATGGHAYGPIIESAPDSLREATLGWGPHQRPADYLDAFATYLREHQAKLPALLAVTQRPRDLTRAALRELRLTLDQAGFPEQRLRVAWQAEKNEDIAATILGHIRQAALGSPLIPYAERISRAHRAIQKRHTFSAPQLKWLARIVKQLEHDVVLDRHSFDDGQFAADGGFPRIDKTFDHRLETILGDLAEEIWRDAG